ncbi:hypothetical protein Btru_055404 [Bulinus truncatus]|nr:hypothetical protein Btru_055404 [Bulinus truncatus]
MDNQIKVLYYTAISASDLFPISVSGAKSPNIVFILTDDQDVALLGQYPMPKTKQLIADTWNDLHQHVCLKSNLLS